MSDETMIIDVEADAAAATKSSKAVADELTRVVNNVAALESKLRSILTGQLPKGMEQLAGYLQTIQTSQNFPVNGRVFNSQVRNLASGGPAAQLDRAAFQGALTSLRNDKSVQALTYEKELNKVLEARATIYNRLRDVQNPSLSESYRTKSYRDALKDLGSGPASLEETKSWNAKTLAEVRRFEEQRLALQKEFDAKQIAEQQQTFERMATRSFSRVYGREDQAKAGATLVTQLQAYGARRGVDTSKLQGMYDEGLAAYAAGNVAKTPKPPKVQTPAPTQDEKIAASMQNIKDRFNYNGGAGMFGVQATILRNYATMGAVLGTMSFVSSSTTQFEASLKDIQAIAAATDTEMGGLSKAILEVGMNSKLSTKDIADGAKILAQAGYSVQQIQQMLKPINDLAVGSGSSLADAAAVTTSVLQVFDMSIGRTSEVTNLLVAGLNQSKLSMEQLSLGIQYAGNTAASGGVQFDEMVAALGAMANAGIKSGSTLGTGLRSVIQTLEAPTAKFRAELAKLHLTESDVDIKTHGLAEVMRTLKDAGLDSSAAMQSMNTRAAAAYIALSNNLDLYQNMDRAIQGTTAATDAAAVQMDSFSAQWQRLLNIVTQVSYSLGAPVLGALAQFAKSLGDILLAARGLTPEIQVLAALLTAIALTKATTFLVGLAGGFTKTALSAAIMNVQLVQTIATTEGLAAALALLGGELIIPAIIAGLTLLILHLGNTKGKQAELNAELDRFKAAAHEASAQAAEYQSRMGEIDKYIEVLSNRHTALANNVNLAGQEADKATSRFGQWGLTMDESGRRVDGLIQKLVKLRGEMASVAHDQALKERGELQNQAKTLDQAIKDQTPAVQRKASSLLGARSITSQLRPNELAALQALSGNGLSLQDLLDNAQTIRAAQGRLGEKGRPFNGLLGVLAPLTSTAVQRSQVTGQLQNNSETLANTSIAQSSSGRDANLSIVAMANAWRDQQASVDKLQGRDKVDAQAQLDARKRSDLQGLNIHLQDLVHNLAQDPEISAGYTQRAKDGNVSVEQAIMNDLPSLYPALAGVRAGGDDTSSINDPKVLRARYKRLLKEANEARGAGRMDVYAQKRAQAKIVLGQMNGLSAGEDADGVESISDDTEAGFDADTRAGMRSGANRAARSGKRTAQADVKSLERQIEIAAGNAGPSPKDMAAAAPQLNALLDQWEAASRKAIQLGGGSAADIQQQLEDFNEKAKEFRDKVLGGNLQAMKDLLAKYADEAAQRAQAQAESDVRAGKVPLQQGIDSARQAINDATTAAIDASDQQFKAKGLDPKTAHDAVEARRKIMLDAVQRSLEAINAIVDAEVKRVQDQLDQEASTDNRARARIGAMNNYWGTRNVGDTHRALGDIQTRQLDERAAQRDVVAAQTAYGAALQKRDELQRAHDANPLDANVAKQLDAADQSVHDLAIQLQRSQDAMTALAAKTQTFGSMSEAATAAWRVFLDQLDKRPVFEQMADGLLNVFQTSRDSFGQLVTDVLSGTKTMGQAFKDFAVSILKSMLDMAAKIVANQILMWIIKMIIGSAGGGAAGGSAGMADIGESAVQFASIGGEIRARRYAAGGENPNRDSVLSLLEPGEVVWRKSAVDMIGRENLLEMNAMGNRRTSSMPTLQDVQRDPDQVNVWVVKEEARPPMTKKDVIATVTEDMMTGGQTKTLVKAIQMGAA